MIEPEDPESVNEEIDGNDAEDAGVPWYPPGQEESADEERNPEVDDSDEGAIEEAEQLEILRIWCPDCGQELNILREHVGMQGLCLNCSLPIVVSMRPGEQGNMRVHARRLDEVEEGAIADEANQEGRDVEADSPQERNLSFSEEAEAPADVEGAEDVDLNLGEQADEREDVEVDADASEPESDESGLEGLLAESSSSIWPVAASSGDHDPLLTEGESYGANRLSAESEEASDEEKGGEEELESGQEDLSEAEESSGESLDEEVSLNEIPVPSWMKSSLGSQETDEEEGGADPEAEQQSDTESSDSELSSEEELGEADSEEEDLADEIPLPSWMKKVSEEQGDEEEAEGVNPGDEGKSDEEGGDSELSSEEESEDEEADSEEEGLADEIPLPSWMEKVSEEQSDEEEAEGVNPDDEGQSDEEDGDSEMSSEEEPEEDSEEEEADSEEEDLADEIPLPTWMKKNSEEQSDEEEVEGVDPDDEGQSDEEGGDSELSSEEESNEADEPEDEDADTEEDDLVDEIPLPSWMKKRPEDKGDEEEAEGVDPEAAEAEEDDASDESEDEQEGEDKSKTQETGDADVSPSWAKGGNPWDALGLSEQKSGKASPEEAESQDKEVDDTDEADKDDEDSEGFDCEDEADSDDLDDSNAKGEDDSDLDEDELLLEEEESRLSLIIAVVIILVVGIGAAVLVLKPDLVKGKKASSKSKTVAEKRVKSTEAKKADKVAVAKPEKKVVKPSEEQNEDLQKNAMVTKSGSDDDKTKMVEEEPKAVERPQGQAVKRAEAKPQMATARAEIHDDVALRMHQEGERAIRSFYRARSVEERSAFVLNPDWAVQSMREFYNKADHLPTLRYVEFKGKVSDPTSGFRFGVFDVHEKENEEVHRWSVVEIEPGQYALDWGLYEQLESSTLIAYLAKKQDSAKKFRFLMKLGDEVSAIDSPWNEEAIKVYLQLPLASSGGEAVLVRKSAAKKLGLLEELAAGKMKIGQVELQWVSGDKDPGSKVPTISKLEGWGAWSKTKMRGLN